MFEKQKAKRRRKREDQVEKDALELIQLREYDGCVCICYNNRPLVKFDDNKTCGGAVKMLQLMRAVWATYVTTREL